MTASAIISKEPFTAELEELLAQAVAYKAEGRPIPASIRIKIDKLQRWLGIDVAKLERRPIKMAKVERVRHPAHPLIAGFAIEHFLRHLANDPSTHSNSREIAKAALTGRIGGTGEETDPSQALWMLHDTLQEEGHPLNGAYNLMSAAQKIHTDAHTAKALHELAAREPAAMQHPFGTTPTQEIERGALWHASDAARAIRPHPRFWSAMPRQYRDEATRRLDSITGRVLQLDPSLGAHDVHQSIRRHAFRDRMQNYGEIVDDGHYVDQSKKPLDGGADAQEKASRYRRRPIVFAKRRIKYQYHPNHMSEFGVVKPEHVTSTVMALAPQVVGSRLAETAPFAWANNHYREFPDYRNNPDPDFQDIPGSSRWEQAERHARRLIAEAPKPDWSLAPILADALQDAGMEDGRALELMRRQDFATSPDAVRVRDTLRSLRDRSFEGLVEQWNRSLPHQMEALKKDHEAEILKELHHRVVGKGSSLPVGFIATIKKDLRGNPLPGEIWYKEGYYYHNRGRRFWSPPNEKQGRPLTSSEYRSMIADRRARKAAEKATKKPPEAIPPSPDSPSQLSRRPLRFSSSFRGDFIQALHRAQSDNQSALRQTAQTVAARLGMPHNRTVNALHDSRHGATPGVAQAIYGRAKPEAVHSLAAWIGLTGNLPGMAVFHVDPQGPDSLYKFKHLGSGMELRNKLDRFGIGQRVILPKRTGFEVLVPDVGGRQGRAIQQFADRHKVDLESSRGHFKVMGDMDQSKARDEFRKTTVKMSRPVRYMREGEALIHALAANRLDDTRHLIFTDWLEENGHPTAAQIVRRGIEANRANGNAARKNTFASYIWAPNPHPDFGFNVPDAAPLELPHAFLPPAWTSQFKGPRVGVNVIFRDPDRADRPKRGPLQRRAFGIGITTDLQEAHQLFSQMEQEGVPHSDLAKAVVRGHLDSIDRIGRIMTYGEEQNLKHRLNPKKLSRPLRYGHSHFELAADHPSLQAHNDTLGLSQEEMPQELNSRMRAMRHESGLAVAAADAGDFSRARDKHGRVAQGHRLMALDLAGEYPELAAQHKAAERRHAFAAYEQERARVGRIVNPEKMRRVLR